MKFFDYIMAAFATSFLASAGPVSAKVDSHELSDHSHKRMFEFDDPFFQNSARAGVNVMFICRAKYRPAIAKRVLANNFMSADQMKSLRRFQKRYRYDSSCNLTKNINLNLSSAEAVGGLAEYFLITRYDAQDIEAIDRLTPFQWQSTRMKARNANERFGLCVVQLDGKKIFQLIKTIPDTGLETKAFKAIIPLLGTCIEKGSKVSLGKDFLRSVLAFSLFRSVHQHQEMMEAAE